MRVVIYLIIYFCCSVSAFAGTADVVGVKANLIAPLTYRFDVTLKHSDAGWDHYADKWQVVLPDGRVIGTRILAHPHVHEQPFTRSLSNVKIAADVKKVIIRAHDKVHGFGGAQIEVMLQGN